jgi:hypothetical protein
MLEFLEDELRAVIAAEKYYEQNYSAPQRHEHLHHLMHVREYFETRIANFRLSHTL